MLLFFFHLCVQPKKILTFLPLGTNPVYVKDSYQIDDGNDGNNSVEKTVKYLEDIYYY